MNPVETKHSSVDRNSRKTGSLAHAWPWLLWLAILICSSLVFSVGFSCATPLVALGAAAAVTMNRRDALLVSGVIWLINQCVGYTMLGYPWTFNSVAWGIALGAATLLTTLVAAGIYRMQTTIPKGFRFGIAFATAFLAFEAAIYAVAFFLGGLQDFTLGIVSYVFVVNAATFLGLLVLDSLVVQKGSSVLQPVARLR